MATLPSPFLFFFLLSLSLFAIDTQAQVPAAQQFKWVNQGPIGEYFTEFGAYYRDPPIAGFFRFPFRLTFYNTTPNAHVLAIRMGSHRGEAIMRWVWDANRNNPVHENATLTFGRNGNLVLAEADGRIVWQTNTANRGVTGFSLHPNGNLVLHDKNGRFLWQSFDHPTDTLLVGQSLRLDGTKKLVSRTSNVDGSDGPYSFAIGPNEAMMYMNHSGTLLPYGGWKRPHSPIEAVILAIEPDPIRETEEAYAFYLNLHILVNGSNLGEIELVRINYNSTYSFLRLGSDGNLRTFTYYNKVLYSPWMPTYAFFSGDYDSYPFYDFGYDRRCGLPKKCGSFGLCREGMCVACPQRQGMLGWSENCAPPKLSSCKVGSAVDYYKIDSVEHFLSRNEEGVGPMKVEECREKCSKDCKCAGFFYWKDTSKCWLVPVLGTLRKVEDSSHTAYIKFSK
ncbi:EP1-like glycoprotein 2 [Magnolia sinica]|uniref:EP1-like glycoprotein 2 n=1 Tax=Magnolia sinica TaxID=86752 RepID=UPI002657DAC2|nr:EP1-like glycoprotein 2 [Magnolia sinica]